MTVNRNVSSSPPNWIQRIAYQYLIIQHHEMRIYAYLGRLRINLAGLAVAPTTVSFTSASTSSPTHTSPARK